MSEPLRYDSACEDLARHFLPNDATDAQAQELAQYIQDAVEDCLATMGVSL